MDGSSRTFRIAIGALSAVWVPFGVTALYRLLPAGLSYPMWTAFPFLAIGIIAVLTWRFTKWKSAGIGMLTGLVVYGVFLTWLLWVFSRGRPIP